MKSRVFERIVSSYHSRRFSNDINTLLKCMMPLITDDERWNWKLYFGSKLTRGRRGSDGIVVGFITNYAINAYHY